MVEPVSTDSVTQSELGQQTHYDNTYNPARLFPILREDKRREIGLDPSHCPFNGWDSWNHYEVSWLNAKGKPEVAVAEIRYDCHTPCIIESKSMKLYFNSLNNTKFASTAELQRQICDDLSAAVQGSVWVNLQRLDQIAQVELQPQFAGTRLDLLDIECDRYVVFPDYLTTSSQQVEETLTSDLLKSNCLVTNQPDWGSVQIHYRGPKIDHAGLLRYIVSFRNHNEFHEQCIERIFFDLWTRCQPEELSVYGRYTRRGGLDINPFRTSLEQLEPDPIRLVRQ